MVEVIWQNAASPPHTDGSVVYARWRQCASLCNASLGPPGSTSHTASQSVQPFFAEFTAQSVFIFYSGPPLSRWRVPVLVGGSWSPSNARFLWAHPSPQPKRQLDRFNSVCRAHDRVRQADRQTDHATRSVTIVRIYVRSTAMRSRERCRVLLVVT